MAFLHQLDVMAYRLVVGVWDLYWPALVAVGLLTLVERRFPLEANQPWRPWRFNILWDMGMLAFAVVLSWTLWGELIVWLGSLVHGLPRRMSAPDGRLEQLTRLALALLAHDFFAYWAHRLQHALPALWVLHQIHHDERHMNAATSLRAQWLNVPYIQILVLVPMMWLLGYDAMSPAAYVTLGAFQAFTHINVKCGFGRFSNLLVSPQYHRIHHARARELHDRNFATMLPLWDILFGTIKAPAPEEYKSTGLIEIPPSDAFFKAFFQPLVDWSRILRHRSPRA